MAVSTSSTNSFALSPIVSEFNPFISTTNPTRALGSKVEDAQGNIYRWAHFGATTTQGKVVSQDVSESSYVDTDNVILAPASCVTTTDNSVGSYYVEITLASITADQFAGGKLITTDDTGEGYTYPIESNTATNDPATGTFRLKLKYPLQVALDATTDFCIIGSRYGNLEPALAGNSPDADPVGVSLASQAAGDYGWILTKGSVGVLQQGAVTDHQGLVVSNTVAGAAMSAPTATTAKLIGYSVMSGDDTGFCGAVVNCE